MAIELSELRKNTVFVMVCLLLSVLMLFETTKMPPNAAQYPRYLAILLALLSLISLVVSIRKRAQHPTETLSEEEDSPDGGAKNGLVTVIQIMLSLCVAVMIMKWVGFIVSMILLMLSTIFVLGYRRPIVGLSVSCLTVVVVYFIFTSVFGVPLAGIS